MTEKGGKSEHFFVTRKHFLKKLAIFYHFFGQKEALILAFNAFFTSTFGQSAGPKGYGFSAVLLKYRVSILADFGYFDF